jgi:hypothetical protein
LGLLFGLILGFIQIC